MCNHRASARGETRAKMFPNRAAYLPPPLSEECSNGIERPETSPWQSKSAVSLELWHLWCHGGDNGVRTHGLWLAKPSLCQLSYVPKERRPGREIDERTRPPCNGVEKICPRGAGCGGRVRTGDILVMSQASYHCSTPRYKHGPTYRDSGHLFTTS